jgi:hypothetical protein
MNYASRHKDVAWLFIQWATSMPIQERMGPLCIPSRLALWDTGSYRKVKQQGWVDTAKWYVENGTVTEPLMPEFREVGEAMSVGFSKILKAEPVGKPLDTMQRSARLHSARPLLMRPAPAWLLGFNELETLEQSLLERGVCLRPKTVLVRRWLKPKGYPLRVAFIGP